MACGERVEVEETYWTWCWAWFVPYPCKKTRRSTKYRYDFLPWRTRITWPFRCKYEGCCGAYLYSWSRWCWLGTGNSAWNEFSARTEFFASTLGSIDDCPFSSGPIS